MATKFTEEHILQRISRAAQATVTTRRFVKANSSDHEQCNPASTNEAALGVALNGGSAGEQIEIATHGIVMVDAGGTIALNDEVVSDSAGKAVARGTTATTLYQVQGRALNQAASGEQVAIQLSRHTVWGGNAS